MNVKLNVNYHFVVLLAVAETHVDRHKQLDGVHGVVHRNGVVVQAFSQFVAAFKSCVVRQKLFLNSVSRDVSARILRASHGNIVWRSHVFVRNYE